TLPASSRKPSVAISSTALRSIFPGHVQSKSHRGIEDRRRRRAVFDERLDPLTPFLDGGLMLWKTPGRLISLHELSKSRQVWYRLGVALEQSSSRKRLTVLAFGVGAHLELARDLSCAFAQPVESYELLKPVH